MGREIPKAVEDWLLENGCGGLVSAKRVGGGCIHNGRTLLTGIGRTFFLKTNANIPGDLFQTESQGLQALAGTACIRVPVVLLVGPNFLLLEDLAPAPRAKNYWVQLGRQLACVHGHIAESFGLDQDNYLGTTPQPNERMSDGYAFFAKNRLDFQVNLAVRNGYLISAEARSVAALAGRLQEWIPEQPASLLHGDLWSGNLLTDSDGMPALIDPAVYYGWRETDLAMMVLFGSPPAQFFDAYHEYFPLPPGLHDRIPLYNLYHLLNHLNLFGPGYYRQVIAVLERFL